MGHDADGACRLADGPNLAPETARRLACDATTFTIATTLSVARGDTFSAGAESWVVVGIQPDGTGLQVLQLARS